jgi:tetratricopeptide (TPR) repeat protein
MSKGDWFRNSSWNESIEKEFMAKLQRAKRKEQYLRIQASTLASTEPAVALRLLEQYFALNDEFDHAQAYCDMATAYTALGNFMGSIQAYRQALDREAAFPKLKTDAYLAFPAMIVENQLKERYHEALSVLNNNADRPMFPVDFFRWHALVASIEAEGGSAEQASIHAAKALEAAQIKKSGFRFHQNLGLVGEENSWLVAKARAICA